MSSHHRHQCCNRHYCHYHVVYNRYNDYYQQYLVQLLPHKFLFLPTIITNDGNEHNIRIQIHLKSKYKYKYKISKSSHFIPIFISKCTPYSHICTILIQIHIKYKYKILRVHLSCRYQNALHVLIFLIFLQSLETSKDIDRLAHFSYFSSSFILYVCHAFCISSWFVNICIPTVARSVMRF